MPDRHRHYRSYLVRMWQAASLKGLVWRGTIEETLSGKCWTFTNLASLCAFLIEQTNSDQEVDQQPPSSDMSISDMD